MNTPSIQECPYGLEVIKDKNEVILSIGPWHEHFSQDEYLELIEMSKSGSLLLLEKLRGDVVVAAKLVQHGIDGECLISEYGLLLSPFWKKKTYKTYRIKDLNQSDI